MCSEDIVISATDVTKVYRIFRQPADRIKQALTFGLKRYHEEHLALDRVSFDVKRGETVGLIGRNGAGKSTLLQLVCGILKPTSGDIEVRGRVSAMLELGAGFNPDFTGRENVFFFCSLMGLSTDQTAALFGDIEAFAEIGEFIDQPVRTYSSGMFVRLAFAAAIHVDPDILVVDEVLAVGDTLFQQKCFDLIYELQAKGVTILYVSHNPYQIERLCHRAAVFDRGKLSLLLPAKEVLSQYHEVVQDSLDNPGAAQPQTRVGTQAMVFDLVSVRSASGGSEIHTNEPIQIISEVSARFPMRDLRFRFEICSSGNDVVATLASNGQSEDVDFNGRGRVSFLMEHCQLTSGWYYVNAIVSNRNVRLDTCNRIAEFKVVMRDRDTQRLTLDQGILVANGEWEFAPGI